MSRGQILLVGGDPDVAHTLQVYLETHQFSVRTASRGDEALSACLQLPPDVVILNWYLPDMKGYDVCQLIRADERAGDSFILVLLSVDDREAKLAALEAGADDVMVPPIDIERVRLRIENVDLSI